MPQPDGKWNAHKGLSFEECPSIDMLKGINDGSYDGNKSGYIAITLSPPDSGQFFDEVNRIDKFKQYHTTKLCKFAVHAKTVTLYGEVSPTARLHLHGWFNFETYKKKLNFYIDYLHYLQSNYMFEIDTIKDFNVWEQYCSKQKLFEINQTDMVKISKAVQLATRSNPYMDITKC